MQNAIFSVDDKQKAKGKGNILKFVLNKLNGNLAVFFNEWQNVVVSLGNDTLSQAGTSVLFLVQHSGSLTPYLTSAPAFSALSPSSTELMLTLYGEANFSYLFLPYPLSPAASNTKQYGKSFQY